MDKRDEFRIEPVRAKGIGRSVPVVTLLVTIAVGVAILQPWGNRSPVPAASGRPRPSTGTVSGPTLAASPSPRSWQCYYAGGWRVFGLSAGSITEESSQGPSLTATRIWLVVEPLADAIGPDDPRIPFVLIVSDSLAGLGYCAPPGAADQPPEDVTLDAWRLPAGANPAPLTLVAVPAPPDGAIDSTQRIFAPRAPDGLARLWEAGRYVFSIRAASGPRYERWYGVTIQSPRS